MSPKRRFDEYHDFPYDDMKPRRRSNLGCIIGILFVGIIGIFISMLVLSRRSGQSPKIESQTQNTLPVLGEAITLTPLPTSAVSPTNTLVPAELFTPSPTVQVIPKDTLANPAGKAPDLFDPVTLGSYMLSLINTDRQANGLNPVAWDPFAAQVGQAHAEEMALNNYLSHWNLAGQGPDIRYGLAGGTDMVRENVYSYYQRFDDGSPVPVADWNKLVFDAEQALMESPGHRDNILDPDHTHVGIGLAYDPVTGEFRIAQEFVNRYLEVEPVDRQVSRDQSIIIHGQLIPGVSELLVNLLHEPFPTPLTVAQLNQTSTYESPAKFLDEIQPELDNKGNFAINIPLWPGAKPGLYHVVIWVYIDGREVPVSNVVLILE